MRRLAHALLAALALAWAGLACQLVAGIDRVEKVERPEEAGAPDAPPEPVDPCAHRVPPSAPDASGAAGEDDVLPPFLVAVRTLSLVPPAGAQAPGFDLDGVCTCETRSPTAGDGGPTCLAGPKTPICDRPDGVDNQAARLFDDYKDLVAVDDAANINNEIAGGRKTILLQIAGYNGLPNDPSVKVGVFASEGLFEMPPDRPGCDASTFNLRPDLPDASTWTPTWCGDDTWSIVQGTALTEQRPLVPVRTGSGWVRDGVLVVEVNDALQIPFLGSVLSLVTARIVGKLVPLAEDLTERDAAGQPANDAEKRLFELRDGVIAGRVTARDILVVAGSLDDPTDKQSGRHLCTSPLFDTAKEIFCGYLDISSTPQRDGNLSFACDALSAAFGFTAFPAKDGEVLPRLPNDNECRLGEGDSPVDAGRDVTYSCPLPEAGP